MSDSDLPPLSKPNKSLREQLEALGFEPGKGRGAVVLPLRRPSGVPQEMLDQINKEIEQHRFEITGQRSSTIPGKKDSQS